MTEKDSGGLTDKQRTFVEEYLVDLNATQTAIRAGYSKKMAAEIGCENLIKPKIAVAIAEVQAARSKRTEITADMVLEEITRLGFANMGDYIRIDDSGDPYTNLSEIAREQAAALAAIQVDDYTEGRGENARDVRKVPIKFHDKKGALVEIGKHLGMFTPRIKHTGNVTISFDKEDEGL